MLLALNVNSHQIIKAEQYINSISSKDVNSNEIILGGTSLLAVESGSVSRSAISNSL